MAHTLAAYYGEGTLWGYVIVAELRGFALRLLLLGPASSLHTQRWVEALVERGIDVTLVTQHEPTGWAPPERATLRLLPVRGAVGYFVNAPVLARILAEVRPDLVNAHYASGYGTSAALVGYRPTVLSVWGSDVFDFPDQSWLAGRLVRWNLRRAQRIASTSRVMAAQVRKLVPKIADVAITPFGVNTDIFRPLASMRDPGVCIIGTVKTMADKYGIDVLIRAFGRLLADPEIMASGLRLQLLLVGDGSERGSLEALARECGVESSVQFVGQVSHHEVPRCLGRLDIFAAPSRLDSESFGVAVIEASSCGLPVVVSDAGGLPEVVESGTTGFIVPREDDESLAGAIKRLVLDADLRRRMGSAGREFVRREYEWGRCVDRMIECYEAVVRDFAGSGG